MIHENKRPMNNLSICAYILEIMFDLQNKGLATVFFDLAGHVQKLQVRIFAPVWVRESEPTFDKEIYLDDETQNIDDFLDSIKDYASFLKEKEMINHFS